MTDARAYQKRRRADAKANGICVVCIREPAAPGITRCLACRERALKLGKARYERVTAKQRAGVVEARTEREYVRQYQPLDETLSTPRVRILRRLMRADWITMDELFSSLDVPTYDGGNTPEWKHYAATLFQLRVSGLVETNETVRPYEYRITDKGRAAAERPVEKYRQQMERVA